jgi:hypothetical protein
MTTNPEAASATPTQPIQSTTQPDAIKAPDLTDTPKAGFRPFFNPATGEWITYTALAETPTAGETGVADRR